MDETQETKIAVESYIRKFRELLEKENETEMEEYLLSQVKSRNPTIRVAVLEHLTIFYQDMQRPIDMEKWGLLGVEAQLVECMKRIAHLYETQGHFVAMEKWYKRAIVLQDTTAMSEYGRYLAKTGSLVEARDLWLRGARLNKDPDCIGNSQPNFTLSILCRFRGTSHFILEFVQFAYIEQ